MLEAQKIKRIARKEAFLTWQAGQREKGAAHRLVRQSRTAEKGKRHHYHSQKGHIIPVAHHSDDGCSTNRSLWSPTNNAEFLAGKEPTSTSSYLSGKNDTVVLSLSRK
ncbi:hypothetical protein STCU_10094 [Strigomonas culicis]|uniref:Uncharacterized protein n=1 Tax=Strigomonas culicis TaxID=28005 RepID=S9TJI4_9TRYP|nr:hypothetical protein STCU_10094 [Strigomonas culicis]|eukprot:EPY18257.1 hypothetical protein STCU_10094 [Strigomonas culicis]